jgi:hypothetical protein
MLLHFCVEISFDTPRLSVGRTQRLRQRREVVHQRPRPAGSIFLADLPVAEAAVGRYRFGLSGRRAGAAACSPDRACGRGLAGVRCPFVSGTHV